MNEENMASLAALSPELADGLLAPLREALGTGARDANLAALGSVKDWNGFARLAIRKRRHPGSNGW